MGSRTNDVSQLYAPQELVNEDPADPARQALTHLVDAWKAIEALESNPPGELARWDKESLVTARKGTRCAWLALSNLSRSLQARRRKDGEGP